jgi:hypothetical protein
MRHLPAALGPIVVLGAALAAQTPGARSCWGRCRRRRPARRRRRGARTAERSSRTPSRCRPLSTVAGERVRDAGLDNVRTILALPDDPLLSDASVDRIFIWDTWHHITDRGHYAEKLRKTLRPGGQVVVVDFQKAPLSVGPPPEMGLSRAEVVADFEQHGFRFAREESFLPYQSYLVFAPTADAR